MLNELEFTEIEEVLSNICDLEDNTVVIVLNTSEYDMVNCPEQTTLSFSFTEAKSEIVKDVIRGITSKIPILSITVKGTEVETVTKYVIKSAEEEPVEEPEDEEET